VGGAGVGGKHWSRVVVLATQQNPQCRLFRSERSRTFCVLLLRMQTKDFNGTNLVANLF